MCRYGAAKNLTTFAKDGEKCTVNGAVEEVVQDFVEAQKPIGMCCIAPVIAAKLIPGCEITLGTLFCSPLLFITRKREEREKEVAARAEQHLRLVLSAYIYILYYIYMYM